jgi:hypothetical protein
MIKYIIMLLVFTLVMLGCASKRTIIVEPGFKPTVIIVRGSDPVPHDLIDYIIKRTNVFCVQKSKRGVRKVAINHTLADRSTTVIYTCIGQDPSRLVEEVLPNQEIYFISLPLFMEMLGG